MSVHVANQIPYMRVQRNFPLNPKELLLELDKSYVDTAAAVNQRTISTFSSDLTYINGEAWYFSDSRRPLQGYRQVYPITTAGTYPHNLDFALIASFVRIWGCATDGTLWYPLPYVDVTSSTNQILLSVDSSNINVTAGAGAPPSITSGNVILEWIA